MTELKVGMYVRVSVDFEDYKNPRMFALGQIERILDNNKILVVFYKNTWNVSEEAIHEYIPSERIYDIEDVKRSKILKNTRIINEYELSKVLNFAEIDDDGFYIYYIINSIGDIKRVSEKYIMSDFNRAEVSPIEQMKQYEFHAPFWYSKRKIASESINLLNNFGAGFKTLIGARAFLFEHQIDTIIRALNESNCRLMLADEVGLGKTIEALVILKGFKKKKDKVLLIIPDALVNQWRHEIDSKLWMECEIFDGNNIDKSEIIIISTEKIKTIDMSIIMNKFSFCIIDEAHRLISDERIYTRVFNLCKNIDNLLLLSATPIQNRKEEYLKLLKLLNPRRYEMMDEYEFNKLYEKNASIRKTVHRIYNDMPLIFNDDVDSDDVEEIYEYLEEVSDILEEDKCLLKMVNELDIDDEDYGEEKIRGILAYLSTNYQFEKNIIRHRREELEKLLPKRNKEVNYYSMKSSIENYYENECYEAVINYIDCMKEQLVWSDKLGEYIRIILNAMFSSPWALEFIITRRIEAIKRNIKTNIDEITIAYSQRKERKRIERIISGQQSFKSEYDLLIEIKLVLDKWLFASKKECDNIINILEDPDNIKGRLAYITDFIEQELYDKKIVIFSSWIETLDKLKEMLEKVLGEDKVTTFNVNNTQEELEQNVYKFQNDINCNIMLCDELGGEGRNFQSADAIIHIDIPFLPTVLEQRIGRLDRIGRDKNKEVLNILFISEDTIEMNLFELWNEGLKIFDESLSGLEIALGDINRDVLQALKSDMKYGLFDAMSKIKQNLIIMKELVEEERHYDMAKQLDNTTKNKYEELINHFDKDGGKILARIMLDWSVAVGFKPVNIEDTVVDFDEKSLSEMSMVKTMFSIPNTSKSLEKSSKPNVIRGTFNRDVAVNKEDLVFFAPGEAIFDSIMTNVEEGYKGKTIALNIKYAPFNWEGFVIKWNAEFDNRILIEKGININYASYANTNMPTQQFTSFVNIGDNNIEYERIRRYMDEELDEFIYKKRDYAHLGKRENGNIQAFKKVYEKNSWIKIIDESLRISKNEILKEYANTVDLMRIKREFSQILAGVKAKEKFYNTDENSAELNKVLTVVLNGIKQPKFVVDSIAYIKMER